MFRGARSSLRSADPARLVYGVLAVATVIAAESTRRETFGKLFLASVVTMLLYWVAHAYAHQWAARLSKAGEWSLAELTVSFLHESSILAGAAVPIAVLLVSWAAGVSTETAVTAVLWTAVVELLLLEVVPGIRQGLRLRDLAIQTLLGVSMGVGILALHLLLH